MTLSTHVLDATTGRPAVGVSIVLERREGQTWRPAGRGRTDPDGRLDSRRGDWLPDGEPGVYRITFASGPYFADRGHASFYPEVSVTFELTEAAEHYHVPLLLSPFAYSTYRGS